MSPDVARSLLGGKLLSRLRLGTTDLTLFIYYDGNPYEIASSGIPVLEMKKLRPVKCLEKDWRSSASSSDNNNNNNKTTVMCEHLCSAGNFVLC